MQVSYKVGVAYLLPASQQAELHTACRTHEALKVRAALRNTLKMCPAELLVVVLHQSLCSEQNGQPEMQFEF